MEELFTTDTISLRDLNVVYESLFLRAVARFESFLEQLFLSILNRQIKYKKGRKIKVKMTPNSYQALLDIVFRDDDFLNWLPFKRTQERAGFFLSGRALSAIWSILTRT